MVNASDADTDPVAGIKAYYEKDPRGDEFVEPFAAHNEGIHEGDAAIFFNFRPDRARQMTRVFTDKEFDGFEREQIKLSHFVTMTEYDPTFDVEVAFPKTFPENVLADVIAANGLKQLHTAETEVRPCDVLPQRRHRGAQGGRGARARRFPQGRYLRSAA